MHTFPHSRFAASHFAKFLKFCRYLTIKKKVKLFECCYTVYRTGLQIYEGHDDQLNRPGPMA
jgi:hypothetical protein